MGKRSNFERVERDYYPTPEKALLPLIPHLSDYRNFSEPCAGDGRLIDHIIRNSDLTCYWKSDVAPMGDSIQEFNCFDITTPLALSDCIITNPPWDRKILHPIIEHFKNLTDTWLLFDADWCHTKQSSEYMKHCAKIVSVGRVKWIEDSKMTGKDNCAWYLFKKDKCKTEFYGR